MLTKAVIVEATEDHVIATFQQFVLLVFEKETRAEAAAPFERTVDELVAAFPEGVGLLTIVAEAAPAPSSQARGALISALRDAGKKLTASAVHFEGDTIKASAVRSLVAAVTMIARPLFPHRAFDSLEDACKWLCGKVPDPPTNPAALRKIIDEVRGDMMSIAKETDPQ